MRHVPYPHTLAVMPTGGQPRRSGLLRAALLNEDYDFNGTFYITYSCNAKLLGTQETRKEKALAKSSGLAGHHAGHSQGKSGRKTA